MLIRGSDFSCLLLATTHPTPTTCKRGEYKYCQLMKVFERGGGVRLIDCLFLTPYFDNVCMVGGLVLKPGLPTKDETLRLDE